jgi:hypothetical protein
MRAIMGIVKNRHGTYEARKKVPKRLSAVSRYGDPASLQAHRRPTMSSRAPGETMRSPERLKVIHEALREPEGAARQSARIR